MLPSEVAEKSQQILFHRRTTCLLGRLGHLLFSIRTASISPFFHFVRLLVRAIAYLDGICLLLESCGVRQGFSCVSWTSSPLRHFLGNLGPRVLASRHCQSSPCLCVSRRRRATPSHEHGLWPPLGFGNVQLKGPLKVPRLGFRVFGFRVSGFQGSGFSGRGVQGFKASRVLRL